jgi:branched-chain amino acid transport system ATP-binding protein
MSDDAVLRLENVDLGYGALTVVFGVSLHVQRGELVGLVGGNGSGKSTILRAVSGMIAPFSGRILFAGKEIRGARPHQMAAMGLAHVPMGRQLFPNMSVRENLLLGAYLPEARSRRAETLDQVETLFPDLVKQRAVVAGALSGGQQQMVAIARALMLRPTMLIMDEPSLGLSPLFVKEVMRAIRRVAETGLPILLVEQNVKQVLAVSHRTYVLENGRQVIEGTSAALQGHPLIKKAYLGL